MCSLRHCRKPGCAEAACHIGYCLPGSACGPPLCCMPLVGCAAQVTQAARSWCAALEPATVQAPARLGCCQGKGGPQNAKQIARTSNSQQAISAAAKHHDRTCCFRGCPQVLTVHENDLATRCEASLRCTQSLHSSIALLYCQISHEMN